MLQTKVANAALLRLLWTLPGGGQMVNVIGVNAGATAINQSTANGLGTAIKGAFNSGLYKNHVHPSVALAAVGIRDIRDINLPEYLDSGAAVAGAATGDALARQVALVVSLRTAHAGRGYRGRIYLGGFDENSEDSDGTASAALVTDAGTFITAVQGAINAQGMSMAVVGKNKLARSIVTTVTNPDGTTSTKTKSYPATAGHVDTVISIQVRNDTWDSQRRRTSPGSVSTLFRPLLSFDVETGVLTTAL